MENVSLETSLEGKEPESNSLYIYLLIECEF